jgi:hypothetical protein
MTDETPTIHRDGTATLRLSELLRDLGAEQFEAVTRADGLAGDELAWRQATRVVELCRRAAELAARR